MNSDSKRPRCPNCRSVRRARTGHLTPEVLNEDRDRRTSSRATAAVNATMPLIETINHVDGVLGGEAGRETELPCPPAVKAEPRQPPCLPKHTPASHGERPSVTHPVSRSDSFS